MKNLKKALVLVLAFAMVFGMFTINASAASFTDDEDIVNTEAVSTMTQLGIINGYEDGTFLPTQVVTRAEMAKMISVAMTGGNLPVLGGTSLFSDTAGHWANAYIAYCFNKGIVSGDAGKGGVFRPDATVTATEAAKMMLVALGYNSTMAGFTGADWAINVASAASDKNLFYNLGTINAAAGLSRDNAAQMIYNGIRADLVEYSNVLSSVDGQLVSTPTVKNLPGKTILTEKFAVSVLDGVILSSEYATIDVANSLNTAGETKMSVTTIDGSSTDAGDYTLKTSTPADMVGKSVKVYVKANSKSGNTFTTVFGAPVVSASREKTFTGAAYRTVSDFTSALKAAGINGFAASVTTMTNNGYTVTTGAYSHITANNLLGRGKEVTFIDNDNDGLVDVVKIMAKHVGQVTVYNTNGNGTITVTAKNGSPVTANALAAKTFDKVIGVENVALKDYVLYYELSGKYYVEKADSTTADVTSTKANGTVTAGGVTYYQSALVTGVDGSTELKDAVALGKSSEFYFDNYGNVIYAKAVASASKYLMVTTVGANNALSGLQVKVVNEEGTVSVVYLDSITYGATPTKITDGVTMVTALNAGGDTDAADTIFTYTVKDNGKYALTAPASGNTDATTTGASTGNPTLAGSSLTANANTVFVVKNDTTYNAYTGIANVPNVTTDTNALSYRKADASAEAIVFFTAGTVDVTGSGTSGVFICSTSYSSVLDGNDTVYEYSAIVDGVATTVTATADDIFDNVGYYAGSFTRNSKGQYTVANGYAPLVPVTSVGDGVITAGTGYTYDDSTKVFAISSTGVVTESAIGNIYDGENGTIADMAYIVGKASPNTTVAKYVFVKGQVTAPVATAVTLVDGDTNTAAIGTANFTATTGTVTGWISGSADTVKITVAEPDVDTTSTITINGFAYTEGTDYVLPSVGTYSVIVTTSKDGCADTSKTYTFTVTA